jgi:Zn-dependent peptidase ImmA (M78 family)
VFDRGFKAWCERTSAQERRALGVNDFAPLDAFELAKRLGVLVMTATEIPDLDAESLRVLTKEDPDSWSAVTIAAEQQTLIVLNPAHKEGRESSNIAHELAHIIIGHQPTRVDVSEDGFLMLSGFDKKQEEEAKWLAGCLLLPREALIYVKRQRFSDDAIQQQYRVSLPMLAYRMQVSGVNEQFKRLKQKFH